MRSSPSRMLPLALLLGVLPVVSPSETLAMCSGGPPPNQPPVGSPPGYPIRTIPGASRYQIGDYQRWWGINRDDILMTLKPVEAVPLEEYDRKGPPPDELKTLLSLVGYEGDFCSLVKEVGLRRLRKFPKVADALIAILSDRKELARVRAWAAYALGDLQCHKAVPALIEAVSDADADLRGLAAVALGRMEDLAAYEAILPLLSDTKEGENLRCMAALSLARAQFPKAREALQRTAKADEVVSVRRAALMALGVKATAEERKLLEAAGEERDAYVRAAAMTGLGLAGGSRETLLKHVAKGRESDPVVRAYAALALGISGASEVAPVLIEALQHDGDFNVRGCAALALGRVKAPGVVEALGQAARNRNYAFVSNYASIALGLSGNPEALPHLVEGLGAKQFDLITSSAAGIAILGRPEGADPLLKLLENRHHAIVREYAAVALGRLRVPSVKTRLFRCMEDPTGEVRHATALALAVFGDPEACPLLEKGLEDKLDIVRKTSALGFDLLTSDEKRALTLGDQFRADPRSQTARGVGLLEINRLLNSYMPANYKLPITP